MENCIDCLLCYMSMCLLQNYCVEHDVLQQLFDAVGPSVVLRNSVSCISLWRWRLCKLGSANNSEIGIGVKIIVNGDHLSCDDSLHTVLYFEQC